MLAPAKLNFGLVIRGRRDDGYHEIETLFVPLRLFDELDLEPRDAAGIALASDDPALPEGPANLAVRAAAETAGALGLAHGFGLRLRKRIPVAAGLGGGSSDAAAAILGIETLAGRSLAPKRRSELALSLGADVPFFLEPRPMRGRGVGERLEPLPGVPELWWVLVVLPFEVSTKEVYGAASRELTLPRDGSSIAALLGPCGVVSSPQNDLETVTARRHPEVRAAGEALRAVGARVTGMSGSGPTVYGQFEDRESAERAAARVALPAGAVAMAVSSPGSDSAGWGWGVAKR